MDFQQFINIEEVTIKEFIKSSPALSINEIKNESFSTFDFTFFSAGTHNGHYTPIIDGIAEAKTRRYSSEKYPTGALIELNKLTSIAIEVSKQKTEISNINKTIKGYYLMKYTDKTFLFDLETIDLGQIKFEKLPKRTANSRNIEWIYKAVIIIPYEKAILSY